MKNNSMKAFSKKESKAMAKVKRLADGLAMTYPDEEEDNGNYKDNYW